MHIDHVHIVQLYKHSVAIELYKKVYPDVIMLHQTISPAAMRIDAHQFITTLM